MIDDFTCKSCGLVFPNTVATGNNGKLIVHGTISTICPRCKNRVTQKGGSYAYDGQGVARHLSKAEIAEMLSGPEFTMDVLQQLQSIVERAKSDPNSIAQFTAEANAIVPSLGDKFSVYLKEPGNIISFLTLLLTVISTIAATVSLFKSDTQDGDSKKNNITNNTIIHNYYSSVQPNSLSAKKKSELHRLRNMPPAPKGTNLMPPKNKKGEKNEPYVRKVNAPAGKVGAFFIWCWNTLHPEQIVGEYSGY